jgi:hypothetical protein
MVVNRVVGLLLVYFVRKGCSSTCDLQLEAWVKVSLLALPPPLLVAERDCNSVWFQSTVALMSLIFHGIDCALQQ